MVEDRFEDALREAQECDELLRSPDCPSTEELAKDKPFLGVPFTTKVTSISTFETRRDRTIRFLSGHHSREGHEDNRWLGGSQGPPERRGRRVHKAAEASRGHTDRDHQHLRGGHVVGELELPLRNDQQSVQHQVSTRPL